MKKLKHKCLIDNCKDKKKKYKKIKILLKNNYQTLLNYKLKKKKQNIKPIKYK